MVTASTQRQQDLYRPAFVHNCLLVLMHALKRLSDRQLSMEEEPTITGLIVASAKELIEMEDAEPWMEHVIVLDDPPQNDDTDRLGKGRPRIDIEFVETRKGLRPRFHVEAKRLYRSNSVTEYLGQSGLGMFVSGSYASDWPSAGMLGYVQTDTCATWLSAIERGMKAREMFKCGLWQSARWTTEGLQDVRESRHERVQKSLGTISLFHLLIDVRGSGWLRSAQPRGNIACLAG